MDSDKRKRNFAKLYLTGFCYLAGFSLLFLNLIRPIHIEIINGWVIPLLNNNILDSDFIILSLQDDYWIESRSGRFKDVFMSLPFNGYFWFSTTCALAFDARRILNWLLSYNALLFIIHPILIFGLLNGKYWFASIIHIHEAVYKAIFLSLGMLIIARWFRSTRHRINE